MTINERSDILHKLVDLLLAVNAIEKDDNAHDHLMAHCRAMNALLREPQKNK